MLKLAEVLFSFCLIFSTVGSCGELYTWVVKYSPLILIRYNTFIQMDTDTHTCMHTCITTHTHTHIHACTCAHTHTHTHTHTHMHARTGHGSRNLYQVITYTCSSAIATKLDKLWASALVSHVTPCVHQQQSGDHQLRAEHSLLEDQLCILCCTQSSSVAKLPTNLDIPSLRISSVPYVVPHPYL